MPKDEERRGAQEAAAPQIDAGKRPPDADQGGAAPSVGPTPDRRNGGPQPEPKPNGKARPKPKRKAKPKAKGRKPQAPGGFSQLFYVLQDSAAWADLTAADIVLLLVLIRLYDGKNNGFIRLSGRDAAKRCPISRNTATTSFRRLEDHRFIECAAEEGGPSRERLTAEWRLTWLRCDRTGEAPSAAFLQWRADV